MTDLRVEWFKNAEGNVVVVGEILRDGKPVDISWPVVIVNPPVLVPDGLGGFREDPDEAIRQTLLDLVEIR